MILNISKCKSAAKDIMGLILIDNGFPSDAPIRDSDYENVTRALINIRKQIPYDFCSIDFISDVAQADHDSIMTNYGHLPGFQGLMDALQTFFEDGLPDDNYYLLHMSRQQFPNLTEEEHKQRAKDILNQMAN